MLQSACLRNKLTTQEVFSIDNDNSFGVESQPAIGGIGGGVIYKIINKLNGKIYIGQTRQKFGTRISNHKSSVKNYGLDAAIRKYGWENFSYEVIEECPVEQLNEREKFFIAEFNSKAPNGYNLTDGGDGGFHHTPEVCARISASKKGKKIGSPSPETCAKISASHKATGKRPPSQKGKKRSLETRAKISAIKKGKKHTAETRAKMVVSQKARRERERLEREKNSVENGGNK